MKRTLITSLLASALLFGGGCSDDFDDSALWKGVDEIYNQLTELEKQADQLNDQIRLLSSIVNGGAITSITQDAEGNDVIRLRGPTISNTASPSPRRTTSPRTDPRYERGERRTLLDDYRRRKHRFSERHRRLENPRCGAYSRNGRRPKRVTGPSTAGD